MFGLFKKENTARKEWAELRQMRASHLKDLRLAVAQHFEQKHMMPYYLLNQFSETGLAISESEKKIFTISFIDKDFPPLEFLSDDDPIAEFERDIAVFKSELEKIKEVIHSPHLAFAESHRPYSYLNDDYLRSGYRIEPLDARRISAAAISIDGKNVWQSHSDDEINHSSPLDALEDQIDAITAATSHHKAIKLRLSVALYDWTGWHEGAFEPLLMVGPESRGAAREFFVKRNLLPISNFIEVMKPNFGTSDWMARGLEYEDGTLEFDDDFRLH